MRESDGPPFPLSIRYVPDNQPGTFFFSIHSESDDGWERRGELLHAYEQAGEARVAVCILEILIELRPPSLVGVPVGQGGVWSAPLGVATGWGSSKVE